MSQSPLMLTFSIPSINIHEYPSDPSLVPAYRIAVMQAALEGKEVECYNRYNPSWTRIISEPIWDWNANQYRITPPAIAPGHNPKKLTVDQIGEGYRTLSVEENNALKPNVDPMEGLEYWTGTEWHSNNVIGGSMHTTYRTKNPPDFYLPKKPRYFRPRNRLFPDIPDTAFEEQYVTEFVNRDEVNHVYTTGKRIRLGTPLSLAEMESFVKQGAWVEFDGNMEPFRPKPVIAEGFNPAGLTVEQIGTGYRTLSVEEAIHLRSSRDPRFRSGLEIFSNRLKQWNGGAAGDSQEMTYRTKNPPGFYLPKPVIAEGYNPLKLTEEQVGVKDGWRLLTQEEHDANLRVHGCEYWYANLFAGKSGWRGYQCWTGSEPLRTKRPAGYFLPKPPKQPETVMEWLLTLPKEYRVLAIRNMDKHIEHIKRLDLPSAISSAFVWSGSPEGHNFWESVRTSLQRGSPLPPIPAPKAESKKLVPWTLETMVWPDCVRDKNFPTHVYGVQLANSDGLSLGVRPEGCAIHTTTWQRLYDECEYSIDNGKTWLPCGSLEEEKKS